MPKKKLKYDKESKELISNISHDLKTPVTTIKGYAEGIIDGVADTPEKIDRYVRTIYNKATEMNTLINELTLYSKIDTNKIPYNFNIVSANEYFNDCADDLSVELAAQNVGFGYFNYVEKNVRIIADPEQVKRVIHNIVNNSLKYMDKPKGMINLRVKDVGDFVQIELEDNGKGIAAKDLPNIFDRFLPYRRIEKFFHRRKWNRFVCSKEDCRRTRRQDLGNKQRRDRNDNVFCTKKVSGGTSQ